MKTPKFTSRLWKQMRSWHPGVVLTVLAVGSVGLRLLWIHLQRPAHLEENAAAYGSIGDFYGQLQMNHDGSRFTYVTIANDRGHALFLCDTATGKKHQVIEDKQGVGIWNDDFNISAGPWSPDDSSFLCVVSNQVMVCSPNNLQDQIVIEDKPFSDAVWLTPSTFAYVTDDTMLCLGEKRDGGKWEHHVVLNRNVRLTSLTATGPATVAWVENGEVICRANVSRSAVASQTTVTSAPQTPTNGLALWLDTSKLQQPDQAEVTDLPDLSRKKNDAVSNGTPPTFNAAESSRALAGKGTVHFNWLGSSTNGTGLKTRGPLGISGSAPRSVFVVMRHEADRPMMVSMGDTTAHGALFALEWSERLFLPTGWWADNYIDATSTNWNLLEVVYDGAKQKGYLNGVLRGTANVPLNTVETGVEIGLRDGNDAKAAEGDLAELLVYNRALNISERQQVENYLRGKWFGAKSSQSSMISQITELDGVTGLTGSTKGELLISRTEKGRDSIWRLDTASGASPVKVAEGQSMRDVQWAGPNRFISDSHLDTRHSITLTDLSGNGNKQLLQLWGNGSFEWFKISPDQKQVFLLGSISNEPAPCIWKYDLASAGWHQVISSSYYGSPEAQTLVVSHGRLAVPTGEETYTIFRPANFDLHKKHPLLLGDTAISTSIYGEPFIRGAAACGAVVAIVDRPNWGSHLDIWAQNVQALYDQMKNDPSVDTKRVYLFAVSAETRFFSQLVVTNPAPWRGGMLINPSELPDFSKSSHLKLMPKMLLDDGGEQHQEESFKRFQKDSLNYGVVTEYYLHPGETHRFVGSISRLERVREEKHFIFEE
jgi:hypothetical protein